MAPITFADLADLAAASVLQGLASPFTWAAVLLAVVMVLACERIEHGRDQAAVDTHPEES